MPKKNSQLVCQYLENISRKMLEDHLSVIRKIVGRRSGVYALYRRGTLYYVGLASSLLGRLKGHLRGSRGQSWDRFSIYLTIGSHHIREIESLLLRISDPPGNKVKGKFVNADDLRRQLTAEYLKRQKLEQGELFGLGRRAVVAEDEAESYPRGPKGRVPVLARYAGKVKRLRGVYKGKTLWARVLRDGRISFRGKRYNSPSRAAKAARGRGCNGWAFWTYERAPGDWVPLGELRR